MLEQELVRVYRVAKMLDLSNKRIYQLVQEGRLNAVRLGPRSMRITRKSIDSFIGEGTRSNREELGLPERGRAIRRIRTGL